MGGNDPILEEFFKVSVVSPVPKPSGLVYGYRRGYYFPGPRMQSSPPGWWTIFRIGKSRNKASFVTIASRGRGNDRMDAQLMSSFSSTRCGHKGRTRMETTTITTTTWRMTAIFCFKLQLGWTSSLIWVDFCTIFYQLIVIQPSISRVKSLT